MKTDMLYTNKDLKMKKIEVLYKRKLNSIYIYAESSKIMDLLLKQYKETIADVTLQGGVVWGSKALCNMAKTKPMLSNLDYNLVRELINSLCIDGVLIKKGAVSNSGIKYSFVIHFERYEEFKTILVNSIDLLESNRIVFIKDIQKMFNNNKGSYYWAKFIIDHLGWLGLCIHGSNNNIIGL